MSIDKAKLIEKFKALSPEEKTLFRDAMSEADPEGGLSTEELSTIREMLAKGKGKKKAGTFSDLVDEFFGLKKD